MDQDINIFPEKGGDTSLRITILDEKKTDRQVMQTLVLLIPHFTLENFIRRSGRSSFVVNSQQDAAEVLEHVLNELMGDSVVAGSTTTIKNRISISCNSCFNSLQTEDICFVLQLTVCSDIQTSLNSIFISECLQGENAPFCHLCASKQDAESQFSICEVGCFVIVQLKRFL